jgi:hypothetical protein
MDCPPIVFNLRLAGFMYRFTVVDEDVAARIVSQLGAFTAPEDDRVDLATRVEKVTGSYNFPVVPALFEFRENIICVRSSTGFGCRIDRSTGAATLRLHERHMGDALRFYLRVSLGILALDRGGVLLHCSAVVRDNRGYVFVGRTNSGKSTVARMSASLGLTVLSDDQNLIMPSPRGYTVSGIPFCALETDIETSAATTPLAGLFQLEQDSSDYLEPLPLGVSAALLTTQAPFVNLLEHTAAKTLANCAKIAGSLDVKTLHFTKSPVFWGLF